MSDQEQMLKQGLVSLTGAGHMRIGIGGIVQESHSFSPASSSLDRFKSLLYLRGSEVFEQLRNSGVEIGGALDAIDDATAVPLFYASASSSGRPLDGSTLSHLKQQLLEWWRGQAIQYPLE